MPILGTVNIVKNDLFKLFPKIFALQNLGFSAKYGTSKCFLSKFKHYNTRIKATRDETLRLFRF